MQDGLQEAFGGPLAVDDDPDVEEVNRQIMRCHTDLKHPFAQLFGGIQSHTITCVECGFTTPEAYDSFLGLSMRTSSSIYQAVFNHLMPEDIKRTCENPRCPGTGYKAAKKRTKIVEWPTYLVVYLSRFNPDQSKLNEALKVGEYLLLDTTSGARVRHAYFDLVAGAMHHGTTIHSGHYTVVAKHDDQWYRFDDEEVTRVGFDQAAFAEATLLVYRLDRHKVLPPDTDLKHVRLLATKGSTMTKEEKKTVLYQ